MWASGQNARRLQARAGGHCFKETECAYRSGPSKTWIKVNPKSPRHKTVRLDKFSHLAAGIYSSCHRPKLSDKIG